VNKAGIRKPLLKEAVVAKFSIEKSISQAAM